MLVIKTQKEGREQNGALKNKKEGGGILENLAFLSCLLIQTNSFLAGCVCQGEGELYCHPTPMWDPCSSTRD